MLDSFRTLFASFVSNTKERDLNKEEFYISVEQQYKEGFVFESMHGNYESVRTAFEQYDAYRSFCENEGL